MAAYILKFFVSFFKVALAIVSIVVPILAVSDFNDPWPQSNQTRIEFESEFVFVPIGGSWRNGKRLAQTALLIPRSTSAPKFLSIRNSESGVDVHTDHFRYWLAVICISAGWYFFLSFAYRRLIGSELSHLNSSLHVNNKSILFNRKVNAGYELPVLTNSA